MGQQKYIDEIRRLEAELANKQEQIAQMQQAVRQAQHNHSQLSHQLVQDHARRRAERVAELEMYNEQEVCNARLRMLSSE